jgi:hypothetical protein
MVGAAFLLRVKLLGRHFQAQGGADGGESQFEDLGYPLGGVGLQFVPGDPLVKVAGRQAV